MYQNIQLISSRKRSWGQSLHLRPKVIKIEASYYICGQLLQLWPVITLVASYYICGQLLHLWLIITFVALHVLKLEFFQLGHFLQSFLKKLKGVPLKFTNL